MNNYLISYTTASGEFGNKIVCWDSISNRNIIRFEQEDSNVWRIIIAITKID